MRSRQYGGFLGSEAVLPMVLVSVGFIGIILGIDEYRAQRLRVEKRMENDSVYRTQILEERKHEREEISKLGHEFVGAYAGKMVPWRNWFK